MYGKQHCVTAGRLVFPAAAVVLALSSAMTCAHADEGAVRVKASSVEGGRSQFRPQNAADGNLRTRWSSSHSDPQWILLDLRRIRRIGGVRLFWEAAYARAYEILVSKDARNWARVFRTGEGDGGTDFVHFRPRELRYVKIVCERRATPWGYSLWEIEPVPAGQGMHARASSTQQGYDAQQCVDGDVGTSWKSDPGAVSAELTVDLGGAPSPVRLVVDWGDPYAEEYRVSGSRDGKRWSVLYTVTDGCGGRETGLVDRAAVRYLRIECLKSHSETGFSVREIIPISWREAAEQVGLGRVRGLVGAEGCPYKVFTGCDGSFAPQPHHFRIGCWLYDAGGRRIFRPETAAADWHLAQGGLPVSLVDWDADGLAVRTTTFCRWIDDFNDLVTFWETSISNGCGRARSIDFMLLIRPSELGRPEPGRGLRVSLEEPKAVAVEGHKAIFLEPPVGEIPAEVPAPDLPPDIHLLSEGAVVLDDPYGTAAAVRYHRVLKAGETFRYRVVVPSTVGSGVVEKAAALDFDDNLEAVADFWRRRVPVRLELPERRFVDCFYASLHYLLILMTGDELRPGPLNYASFYLHDAVDMLDALEKGGLSATARKALRHFTYREGDGYLDGLGGSMYALCLHYLVGGDRKYLREVWPRILSAGRLIHRLRREEMTRHSLPDDPAYGLLPASVSQDNFSRPAHLYVDDWWAAVGLKAGLLAARELGMTNDAEWLGAELEDLVACTLASVKQSMRRERLDYMPGFADYWPPGERRVDAEHRILGDTQMAWAHRPVLVPGMELGLRVPLDLFRESYRRYWRRAGGFSGYDGGWYVEYERLFWGYNLTLARAVAAAGLKEVALRNIRWSLENQSCPCGWSEAMNSRTISNGLLRIGPGIVGDVPHGWVAAHYVLLLREMLLRERGGALYLLPCVPDEWFADGKVISISGAPTFFGKMDLHVESRRARGEIIVRVSCERPPPEGYVLYLPDRRAVARVEVNGEDWKVPPGEALNVPLTAREIRIFYGNTGP